MLLNLPGTQLPPNISPSMLFGAMVVGIHLLSKGSIMTLAEYIKKHALRVLKPVLTKNAKVWRIAIVRPTDKQMDSLSNDLDKVFISASGTPFFLSVDKAGDTYDTTNHLGQPITLARKSNSAAFVESALCDDVDAIMAQGK